MQDYYSSRYTDIHSRSDKQKKYSTQQMYVAKRNKNSQNIQQKIDQRILEGIRSQLIPKSKKAEHSAQDEVLSLYTKDASKFGSIDWKSLDEKIEQQGYESKPYSYKRFYDVIVQKIKQSFSEVKKNEHDLLIEKEMSKITPQWSQQQIKAIRLPLKHEIVAVINKYNSQNNYIYNCQQEINRINHKINSKIQKIQPKMNSIQDTSDDIFKGCPLEPFNQIQ
ncbi:Hypothetical_protein [Hexamita inflata]|uniref:Hypothetical_protein n=1 Tax=Hexamita inflata TaxID=28002 RepID=A0AA86PIQ9_9EUKA|nr:Hypothetical protein HINF_LOCUS27456 [Hexamita inflata]CAI9939815.1 Hypothetical protein HINF_LOCUS27460 [Hexamita inflata]